MRSCLLVMMVCMLVSSEGVVEGTFVSRCVPGFCLVFEV
ncbi:hypothetical protein APHCRT_1245 [Anaplasma phagocytophilum str. CRT53-1]|uniref:Uncharacterized protein n=1 Tax=Anaplasma phagocytophilum str. CRT53-1 TaxID=1359157 RepID=A0A0F3PUZ4_ANAPH|nr:hypothetical protein APHCRT_1245 [Anaplasma phagocytophilum str. CRT53-1]